MGFISFAISKFNSIQSARFIFRYIDMKFLLRFVCKSITFTVRPWYDSSAARRRHFTIMWFLSIKMFENVKKNFPDQNFMKIYLAFCVSKSELLSWTTNLFCFNSYRLLTYSHIVQSFIVLKMKIVQWLRILKYKALVHFYL